MTDLRLDWCSYQAAKYAVEHWHYAGTMPVSKCVNIGAWEDGKYIGVLVFAWGANPNLCKSVGLEMVEVAELVRVALTRHLMPVTRIVAIGLKMLKGQSPGLRLCVSYADPHHGHVGAIYQAGNWIYTGDTPPKFDFQLNGQILQRRSYTGINFGGPRMRVPAGAQKVKMPPKHRYLYQLDPAMRRQIEPLRKPYPKRTRPADGGNLATSEAGRFDSDQAACDV